MLASAKLFAAIRVGDAQREKAESSGDEDQIDHAIVSALDVTRTSLGSEHKVAARE
jgi:hypothetical protein